MLSTAMQERQNDGTGSQGVHRVLLSWLVSEAWLPELEHEKVKGLGKDSGY